MSANWSMRSFGAPYFCCLQDNLSGMNASGIGAYGFVELSVTFRLFALPVQHADEAETHALFSVNGWLVGTRVFEVGLTPSGRYSAAVFPDAGGPIALSTQGAVVPDGQWHTLYARWDSGTGDLLMQLDGAGDVTANTGLALPALDAGLSQIMLFNDCLGTARSDVAIREAFFSCFDAATMGAMYYLVDEKSGATVGEARLAGGYPNVTSFDLSAQYFQLSRTRPWGAPPTADTVPASEAYGWHVQTEHTELLVTPTKHVEVAIT